MLKVWGGGMPPGYAYACHQELPERDRHSLEELRR